MSNRKNIPTVSRPHMPGYGLLDAEHGSGLMDWNQVGEQLARARNYWIATTRADGRPHCVPVWGIWFEDAFYFATGDRSQKARNLAANPALAVHLESGDEVVILEGVAEAVADANLLARLDQAYYAKYQTHLDSGQTFTLRPRVAFAWQEKDFPGGATRWRFQDA